MISFEELKQYASTSEGNAHFIKNWIQLILVVDNNYGHIDQLEKLILIMKSGRTDYYKQYYQVEEKILETLSELANKTRANYYKREGFHDDIYALITFLAPVVSINVDEYKFKSKYRELSKLF